MPGLLRALRRLVNLFHTSRGDDALERELAAHLAMIEDDGVRRGLSRAEARRLARIQLGGVEQIKELHRDERSVRWIEDARRDAAYAFRMLRRTPLLAATIIGSLAIGIGGNTAVFTVANALLFRAPAAVADPSRLVDIGMVRDGRFNPVSYPQFLDVQRRAAASAGLANVYATPRFPQALSLTIPGRQAAPSRVFGHFVSPNYFDVLGLAPAAGGWFGADDLARNAVVSDRFRRTWFGDGAAVGQLVSLNGEIFAITGVLPEGFHGSSLVAADLWLPLLTAPMAHAVDRRMLDNRGAAWLIMGGRLKAAAEMPAVNAELEAIGRDLERERHANGAAPVLRAVPSSLVPGNRAVTGVLLSILMGLMSLVLLVACANVSGVLLARADARRQEMAVRLSIGAGRARLARQLLMETVLLFALGSVAGILVARALVSLLIGGMPALPFPVAVSLPLDLRVLAFTTALSLAAALMSGLMPAIRASRVDPAVALKTESAGASSRTRLRSIFVVGQAAISVALVFAAALFTRAIVRAVSADPGYDPDRVEIVSVDLSLAGADDTANQTFWRTLIDRVRHLPRVESASLALALPGGFETWGIGVAPRGTAVWQQLAEFEPEGNIVEPGYFRTMRIPIVAGRDFTDADRIGTPAVVIVDELAARHYWPGQAAVGQYLSETTAQGERALLVVGVAGEIRSSTLIDGVTQSIVYVPLQQQAPSFLTSKMTVVARAAAGPMVAGEIRTLVTSMNPNLPVSTSETLRDSVALGLLPQRIAASVSGSLGLISAVLAGIGIYGISAFAVSRRTREFGIRMALGATRGAILRLVLRQGAVLAVVGAAIGLALGSSAAQILSGFLFGVPPFDPLVLGATAMLFIGIGIAACYGPARRATRVDPLAALKRD